MSVIQSLHGTVAIVLICVLIYVEETGLPLPLVPGDALLIVAGVLIANGSISPIAFFPAVFVATLGGMLTAYSWSRVVGSQAVEGLAARVGAGRALERVSRWLRASGPLRITASRLIPGMRVYTAIVAGAAGLSLPVLLLGGILAIIIWIGVFTGIGIVAGIPALSSLNHVQHLAVTGIALLAIGAGTALAIQRIPAARAVAIPQHTIPHTVMSVLAAVVDVVITVAVVSGVTELLHDGLGLQDPDGIVDLALIAAVIVLAYTAAARRIIGATIGERIFGIRYFDPAR